jgi:hypothetical protein
MTAVTYDMQKLDEAVGTLAGHGTLRDRLQDALIPLGVLHMGGMLNKKRAAQLDEIHRRLTAGKISDLSDDDAREIARKIVELHSGNWHDAVWALEDEAKGVA